MFSGIKSILFGYSEPTTTTSEDTKNLDGSNPNDLNNTKTTKEKSTSVGTDASTLLEQTLNAATTIFTEQLLPQSPSIEQLQSSSHHLLPTLIEQHEEDEKRKKEQNDLSIINAESNVDNDEDDDCFNADSWELLDLDNKNSTIGTDLNEENTKIEIEDSNKTVGILKQQQSSNEENKTLRQEGKVSFNTPDLVKSVDEKIETKSPKDININSKNKNNKTKKKNNNKSNQVGAKSVQAKSTETIIVEETKSVERQTSTTVGEDDLVVGNRIKKNLPILDYRAAALSKTRCDDTKIKHIELNNNIKLENTPTKLRGAIKRNRPVSSSSWSSSDEVESIDSIWKEKIDHEKKQNSKEEVSNSKTESKNENLNDDNESIISSGFSDCDYGYEGLNDFVMRPKKSSVNNIRKAQNSNANPALGAKPKRKMTIFDPSLMKSSKQLESGQSARAIMTGPQSIFKKYFQNRAMATDDVDKQAKTSKNIKPKKKKVVLSPRSNNYDFLKKHTSTSGVKDEPTTSDSIVEDFLVPTTSKSSLNCNLTTQSFLSAMTKSVSPSTSGNDSSDIPEMDESWYVTPPPCFTGSNKHNKAKAKEAKEAARENALIEHPSIYISSTSCSNVEQVSTPSVISSKNSEEKQISLVKVNKQQSLPEQSNIKQEASSISNNDSGWIITNNKTSRKQNNINFSGSDSITRDSFTRSYESNSTTRKLVVPPKLYNKFTVTHWKYSSLDMVDEFETLLEQDENGKPKKQGKAKNKPESTGTFSSFKRKQALAALAAEQSKVKENDELIELISISSSPTFDSCAKNVLTDSNESSIEVLEIDEQPEGKEVSMIGFDEVGIISNKKSISNIKRAPVLVKPIEPERQPGWQLRKKRSKRRPLSSITMSNVAAPLLSTKKLETTANNSNCSTAATISKSSSFENSSYTESNNSSARSSPSLIDRIGNTIVANLTNLTTGFHGSNSLPNIQQQSSALEEAEKFNRLLLRKSNVDANLIARKRMSKSYLKRNNDSVKTLTRRPDRRSKMFSTPNGVSINRKVQTNF